MPKLKKPKRRRRIIGKAREPETRENYHKWPTTSLLVTGLACGCIFFIAANPDGIDEEPDLRSFILQSAFLSLSVVTFFPSLLVLFILFCYWMLKAMGIRIPKWVFKKCPLLNKFHKSAMRESNEDSFLARENQRRNFIGDTMLELSSDEDVSYDDSDADSDGASTCSEVWTTHNHYQSDPEYQYESPSGSITGDAREHSTTQQESAAVVNERRAAWEEFPAVHTPKATQQTPQIVVNGPSPTVSFKFEERNFTTQLTEDHLGNAVFQTSNPVPSTSMTQPPITRQPQTRQSIANSVVRNQPMTVSSSMNTPTSVPRVKRTLPQIPRVAAKGRQNMPINTAGVHTSRKPAANKMLPEKPDFFKKRPTGKKLTLAELSMQRNDT